MKVLQINTTNGRGGASKVDGILKSELERRGNEVNFFVGTNYDTTDTSVFLLDSQPWFTKMLSAILGRDMSNAVNRRLTSWLANDIDLFGASAKILKTPQFAQTDIVHCHNLHSNYFKLDVLAKIARQKPTVWTLHDMWAITPHCGYAYDGELKDGFYQCPSMDIYPPIAWHNEKYLRNKKRSIYDASSFNIVVPSDWLGNKVRASALGNQPLTLIYNGIDVSHFKPHDKNTAREELGLPIDKRIILFLAKGGTANERKGTTFVEEVLMHYQDSPEIAFLNVGGDARSQTGNTLSLPFTHDETLLAKYYSSADVLIYPSLADNCPLVILEALACGLPIVAFNTGGIPELIDHKKTGYIANYRDTSDLLAGIRFVLTLPTNDYQVMRDQAVQVVQQKFTLAIMVDNYIKLYQKILDAPPRRL